MSKEFYGVGFNSKGKHKGFVDGKDTIAYKVWHNMLQRCYNEKSLKRRPAYIGCSVDKQWHDFQDFADWYYTQPYSEKGYQLDKDLLIPGNKIYSPDTCCFVPSQLNSLLTDRAALRGRYPQGVSFRKDTNRIQAHIRKSGKLYRIGYFDTVEDAYQAYKVAKERYVKNMANRWQDDIAANVYEALMQWELGE